jgi:hypothetical protein
MKAEHLRKFRKFGVSRWSEMAFSEFSLPLFARPNTYKRQNKSLVHQKYADFVEFS